MGESMKSKEGIMGFVVADALGVPYEFVKREDLDEYPINDMIGHGTYNQPKGSFSDDSSMILCTIDSIICKKEIDYDEIMSRFLKWYNDGEYTPNGKCFDIGKTTIKGLSNYEIGISPLKCGSKKERDNGNGSLMRILPIAYYIGPKDHLESEDVDLIYNISRLTHSHIRCLISCHIYCEIICNLLKNDGNLRELISKSIDNIIGYYKDKDEREEFNNHFRRIIDKSIFDESRDNISSKGYVISSLEAALWSLVNTTNYKDAVLKAANLGEDTDTIAAISGGIAGIYYGYEHIPEDWVNSIIKKDKILDLLDKFDEIIN